MTNFEKIKALLESGAYKGVRVDYATANWSNYVIYRSVEDENFKNDWIPNIISITPIPNPPKLLPVGTKVRVFEEYESMRLDKSKIYTIALVKDSHATVYISEDWYMGDDESLEVPARAVVPVWED